MIILCLISIFMIFGCGSTTVIEEETRYRVEPNVTAAPPIDRNTMPVRDVYMPPAVASVEPITPVVSYVPQPMVSQNPVVMAPVQPMVVAPSTPGWVHEVTRVQGQCAVNPQHAGLPGQARLMAERGALMDARRNLLEKVLGLRLDSNTVVKDMVTESDQINAQTSGLIRGSSEVLSSKHFDGSIATTEVEMPLNNVYTYMQTNRIYYK